jgi:ribosome-binding protein aMBF1 (putative translation factor)
MESRIDQLLDAGFAPTDAFRRARSAMGMSQAELASLLDVAETTLRSGKKWPAEISDAGNRMFTASRER